jgi:hypothetical protein
MDQLTDSAEDSAVDSNHDSTAGSAVSYIPGANVDAMNGGSARAFGFDDRLPLLEYFTRKEVMKMVFDTSTRLFQSVAFPDRKPLPKEKELALFRQVFDQTVVAACICLSDDVMRAAFERITADLGHVEDPWATSITREFNRIMQQQAGEG